MSEIAAIIPPFVALEEVVDRVGRRRCRPASSRFRIPGVPRAGSGFLSAVSPEAARIRSGNDRHVDLLLVETVVDPLGEATNRRFAKFSGTVITFLTAAGSRRNRLGLGEGRQSRQTDDRGEGYYRELAILGLKMDFFSTILTERRDDPKAREDILRKAYAAGERREKLLLSHRDWAGPDEGLYAFTNDRGLRQWHSNVKKALDIDHPSALTKELLRAK